MLLKVMIVVVILACIGPFFIKGPDGTPLMTLDDWIPSMPGQSEAGSEPTKVYKWQDEHGNWQFTDEPVEQAGAEVETMVLDGDINTMDAFKDRPRSKQSGSGTSALTTSSAPSGLMTVAPDQATDMIETVTDLQGTIDQRKADMDKITGQGN